MYIQIGGVRAGRLVEEESSRSWLGDSGVDGVTEDKKYGSGANKYSVEFDQA